MNINLQDLLTTIGGGGVVLAAAAWLIRTVLNDRLARHAKVFEAQLKAGADAEIERLKHSLELFAVEHQVRFSNLHETRAKVIAEIYSRLVATFWDCQRFVLTGGHYNESQNEKYGQATTAIQEFVLLVEVNRIYLSDGVCKQLDSITEAYCGCGWTKED